MRIITTSSLLVSLLLISHFSYCQQKTQKNFYEIKQNFINQMQDSSLQKEDGERNQLERWANFNESRGIVNSALASQLLWKAKKNSITNSKKTRGDASNWICLGPKQTICENPVMQHAGRVNCIAEHPLLHNILYAGTPDGGLWKSIDTGIHWLPIADMLNNLSIADIVINPTQPNIIYIATGDGFGYDVGYGFWGGTYSMGVLKSIDGGVNWDTTGLSFATSNNIIIRDLEINPNNANEIYASTSDGFYKTINAGTNWVKILDGNAFEVKYAPSASQVLFAVSDSVQKSMDGGISWTTIFIVPNLDSNANYRNSIAISSTNVNKVYFLYGANVNPALYATNNSGTTWLPKSSPLSNFYTSYGYYANFVAVNPTNDNNVFIGSFKLYQSMDGGDNFVEAIEFSHPDHHALVYSKHQSNVYFVGNDAGIYKVKNDVPIMISEDMSIAQLYNVAINPLQNDNVFVGFQDNGTRFLRGGIWHDFPLLGDGMEVVVNRKDTNYVYASIQFGNVYYSEDAGITSTSNAFNTINSAWNTPMVQDYKTGYVYQVNSEGIVDWDFKSVIAPLPVNVYNSLNQSSTYIKRVIVSSSNSILLSKNGFSGPFNNILGNLTSYPGFLKATALSEKDSNRCYAVYGGFEDGSKVFQTNNNGISWQNISGSLPNIPINCILPIKNSVESIYIGTDIGVYYRDNTMTDWQEFNNNMPKVIISELAVGDANNKLYAATYGRGLWVSNLQIPQFIAGNNPFNNLVENNIEYQINNGVININSKYGIQQIELMSASGASIIRQVCNSTIKNKQVNISELANGVYILQIIDTNNNRVTKQISKF